MIKLHDIILPTAARSAVKWARLWLAQPERPTRQSPSKRRGTQKMTSSGAYAILPLGRVGYPVLKCCLCCISLGVRLEAATNPSGVAGLPARAGVRDSRRPRSREPYALAAVGWTDEPTLWQHCHWTTLANITVATRRVHISLIYVALETRYHYSRLVLSCDRASVTDRLRGRLDLGAVQYVYPTRSMDTDWHYCVYVSFVNIRRLLKLCAMARHVGLNWTLL